MLPDRDEFKKLQENRKAQKANGANREMKMIRQAAVRAEFLTGHPHWDIFLSYLQSALDGFEEQMKSIQDVLIRPDNVDHNSILQAKMALAECKGRVDILNEIMMLPKDLIEMGGKAKSILERME